MISCLYTIATEVTAIANPHLLTAAAFNGSVMLKTGQPDPPRMESVPTITLEEMQTALARARQSAVQEERIRLAGEIHDGLAQSFSAIWMQLGAVKEQLSSKEGDPLKSIQRALELAEFGLAEARRCAHNLHSSNESGLAVALQRLVERSSLAGRLRVAFGPTTYRRITCHPECTMSCCVSPRRQSTMPCAMPTPRKLP
jgi:signal transduction histidine kinase